MEDAAYCSCQEMELVSVEWLYQDQNQCLCIGTLYYPGLCWNLHFTNTALLSFDNLTQTTVTLHISWSKISDTEIKFHYSVKPITLAVKCVLILGCVNCETSPDKVKMVCSVNNRSSKHVWKFCSNIRIYILKRCNQFYTDIMNNSKQYTNRLIYYKIKANVCLLVCLCVSLLVCISRKNYIYCCTAIYI
jgi:hypothetical protein